MKAANLTLALAGGFFLSVAAASWAEEAPRRTAGPAANPQAAAKQPVQKPQKKKQQTQPTKPPQTQPANPNGYP